VSERNAIYLGAAVGAAAGALVTYLFYTPGGRALRDRLEPAVDDLVREAMKFRRTLEKVGGMANEGMRAFQEFQQARSQSSFGNSPRTSH